MPHALRPEGRCRIGRILRRSSRGVSSPVLEKKRTRGPRRPARTRIARGRRESPRRARTVRQARWERRANVKTCLPTPAVCVSCQVRTSRRPRSAEGVRGGSLHQEVLFLPREVEPVNHCVGQYGIGRQQHRQLAALRLLVRATRPCEKRVPPALFVRSQHQRFYHQKIDPREARLFVTVAPLYATGCNDYAVQRIYADHVETLLASLNM